jgi:SAM-dependent methyltransferase
LFPLADAHCQAHATLFAAVAERYRCCGGATWRYVSGKLRRDPVYRALLAEPGDYGQVLDIGCGRGQLGLALLLAGRARAVVGLDANLAHLRQAERAASGLPMTMSVQDLAHVQDLPPSDTVVIVDVLYQLDTDVQLRVLRQAARAARRSLLIRTLDPDRGWRSGLTLALEQLIRRVSPHSGARVNALAVPILASALQARGFAVQVTPCWKGTPLSNVLLSACRLLPQGVD